MPGNLEAVKKLFDHPSFSMTNPNSVRALIGAFAGSVVNFHAADGSGYEWFTDQVLAVDKINSIVASQLVDAFTGYRQLDEGRQQLIRA